MLTKNTEHVVTIDGYNSAGQGVARIDGHIVFVKNAIRGETCTILILKALKNVAYAKILSIINPSPHRIPPACENFYKCGGCDFLHMDYTEELELKRIRVTDALRRFGGLGLTVPPVVGSDSQTHYRNKAVYAVGRDADGLPTAGFYREHSHDIIPAGHCLIQTEFSHRAARAVLSWMTKYKIPVFDEKTGVGAVRRIFCRCASKFNSAQVAVVTAQENLAHTDRLIAEILQKLQPECTSIVLNINKERSNTVLAGRFQTIWGDGYITDELCGFKFMISPRSFYQINSKQAQRLYDKAVTLAGLDKNDTALDLYCGTGTITLALSRFAGRVIGAEIIPEAVKDARKNAQLNGVTNAEFIAADAARAAETIKESGIKPAAVVVDPPRKGLTPDVIKTIADMSPRRVVYISCDPATLARDLALFNELGYPPVSVAPFDMFPRCAHVECVVLLSKAQN